MPDGKICYIEIPAVDIEASSSFYERVFGWRLRRRDNGSIAFDDAGSVSGTWVLGRTPQRPGLLTYIMVDRVEQTLRKVVAAGGRVVLQLTPQKKGEAIATFEDPAGNVIGLYQEPPSAPST
jgi:predicted enzyme related to lactoylglutathione lyase